MQYPVFFFLFMAFLTGIPATKEQAESKPLTDSLKCQNGGLQKAWYPYRFGNEGRYVSNYGFENTLPQLTDQHRDSIISLDKNSIAKHAINNNGQHLIRFINNSTDTVVLQTQNGSLMAVMQGLSKSGKWCSLEYWHHHYCLRSCRNIGLLPNAGGSFVAQLPNQGNYETKFRFKFLGKDKFYYSDEFSGKIDYCAFKDSARVYFGHLDSFTRSRGLYTIYQK